MLLKRRRIGFLESMHVVDILDKVKSFASIRFQYFLRNLNITGYDIAFAKFCYKFDVDSEFL